MGLQRRFAPLVWRIIPLQFIDGIVSSAKRISRCVLQISSVSKNAVEINTFAVHDALVAWLAAKWKEIWCPGYRMRRISLVSDWKFWGLFVLRSRVCRCGQRSVKEYTYVGICLNGSNNNADKTKARTVKAINRFVCIKNVIA